MQSRLARFLTVVGVIVLLFLAGRIYFEHEISAMDPIDRSSIRVEIPTGARTKDIAAALVDKGLARSRIAVILVVSLSGKGPDLKAGVYALNRSMSVRQMIDEIAAGKTDTVVVTVPEGFTTEQIAERLAAKNIIDRDTFLKVAVTEGESYTFPDGFAPPRNLEGYLFPLTYTIVKGSSSQQIAGQMLSEFDTHIVSKHREESDWRDVIIVASLVEREAKIDSDRPLIASVYYNRLNRGMALQCDATVQYALPQHKARLMYSDLRVDSPYNTYLHHGLPPGPICNPGEASIEAAINPAQSSYLFYVAGPGGAHLFSRTLAEQDQEIALVRSRK